MPITRFRGRLSARDKKIAVNNGLDHWAAMSGKPVPDGLKHVIAPKRERHPGKRSDRPYERDVLKQIVDALQLDPRVSRVERNQSGVFQDGNRYVRVGVKGKLDLTVYLRSGHFAEIEIKRDARAKPEDHQLQRIEAIRREGGIAGWAWSVESALAILP